MRIKKGSIVLLAVAFFAAVFAMAFFLNRYIGRSLLKNADSEIVSTLHSSAQDSSTMDARRESVEGTFDSEYFKRADSVPFMLNRLQGEETVQQRLSTYKSLLSADNIVIIDGEGNVLEFAVSTKTDFSDGAFKPIRDLLNPGTERHVVEAASGDALYRYYGSVIDPEHIAVLAINRRELENVTAGFTGWNSKLKGIIPGKSGYMAVVSGETGGIIYHPDEDFIGKKFADMAPGMPELSDGLICDGKVDGRMFRVYAMSVNGDYLLAAVPRSDILGSMAMLEGLVIFVFASFLIIMVIYALGIHETEAEKRVLSNDGKNEVKKFSKKVFAGILLYMIVGTVATALVFYYIQTITLLGNQSLDNKKDLVAAETKFEKLKDETDTFENNAGKNLLIKARTVAFIIKNDPECANTQELSEISDLLGLNDINIFTSRGTAVVSSKGTTDVSIGDGYGKNSEFRKILNENDSYTAPSEFDEITGKLYKRGAVVLYNSEDEVTGYAVVSYEPYQLEKTRTQGTVSNVLNTLGKTSKGNLMAISKETGIIAYSQSRKSIGLLADDLNVYNGFSGFLTINGDENFADCIATDDYYIISSLSSDRILKNLGVNTGAVASFTAFILFLFAILLSLQAVGESRESAGQILEFILPDGSTKRRFSNGGKVTRWSEKSPSQKASVAIKAMLLLLCGIVTLIYLFPGRFIRDDSIVNYIIDGNWEKGMNVFAVTSALISVSVIIMIKQVIDFLLEFLASNSDARTETICRLMKSFLKYITALLCIYYCLAKFGVDTDTLLASAGILSLVIGLGAQDLIKDILAGLFIIFEQEFKVGDIVTVDDFTGTVREIGIRATKIEDLGQNIKVINNNQISGVLNKTQKYSFAIVDVGIEYSESIERVEAVLEKELPEIRKKLPDIISGPVYKGVIELAESSVVIRIVATCTEGKRIPLTFSLNREIKLIFDRNGINIPFNQIVVHKED